MVVALRAVVGEVKQVDVGAATVSLGQAVGEQVGCGERETVELVTSSLLHPADCNVYFDWPK